MPVKKNMKYEIKPKSVEMGEKWMDFKFKNKGDKDLTNLNIKLNSMDTYGLSVIEANRFVPLLEPGEETTVYFRVYVYASTRVYVTIDGYKGDSVFFWETPAKLIRVGKPVAELVNVYAMSKPRFILSDKIDVDATIKSNIKTDGLLVEFWAEAPDNTIEEIDTEVTDELNAGQVKVFKGSFNPDQEGLYTIDTYLYDGTRRLGHKTDFAYVEEA